MAIELLDLVRQSLSDTPQPRKPLELLDLVRQSTLSPREYGGFLGSQFVTQPEVPAAVPADAPVAPPRPNRPFDPNAPVVGRIGSDPVPQAPAMPATPALSLGAVRQGVRDQYADMWQRGVVQPLAALFPQDPTLLDALRLIRGVSPVSEFGAWADAVGNPDLPPQPQTPNQPPSGRSGLLGNAADAYEQFSQRAFLGTLAAGADAGAALTNAPGVAVDWLTDRGAPGSAGYTDIGDPLHSFGSALRGAIPEPQTPGGKLGATAGGLAPIIAAGAAGGPIGVAATMGVQSIGDTYGQTLDALTARGVDPVTAKQRALATTGVVAPIETAINMIPGTSLGNRLAGISGGIGRQAVKEIAANVLKESALNAAAGFAESSVGQAGQIAAGAQDEYSPGEALRTAGEYGAISGVLGGATHVLPAAVRQGVRGVEASRLKEVRRTDRLEGPLSFPRTQARVQEQVAPTGTSAEIIQAMRDNATAEPSDPLMAWIKSQTEKRGPTTLETNPGDVAGPTEAMYDPDTGTAYVNQRGLARRGKFMPKEAPLEKRISAAYEGGIDETAHHLDTVDPDAANRLRDILGPEILAKAADNYVERYAEGLGVTPEVARAKLGSRGLFMESLGTALQMGLGETERRAQIFRDGSIKGALLRAWDVAATHLTEAGREREKLRRAFQGFWDIRKRGDNQVGLERGDRQAEPVPGDGADGGLVPGGRDLGSGPDGNVPGLDRLTNPNLREQRVSEQDRAPSAPGEEGGANEGAGARAVEQPGGVDLPAESGQGSHVSTLPRVSTPRKARPALPAQREASGRFYKSKILKSIEEQAGEDPRVNYEPAILTRHENAQSGIESSDSAEQYATENYTFYKKLPDEIKAYIAASPNPTVARRFFKVTNERSQAGGEDWYQYVEAHGRPGEYQEVLDWRTRRGKLFTERMRKLAADGQHDHAAFMLDLADRVVSAGEYPKAVIDDPARTLPAGTEFRSARRKFEVDLDENEHKIIRDTVTGRTYYADAIAELPIDRDSVRWTRKKPIAKPADDIPFSIGEPNRDLFGKDITPSLKGTQGDLIDVGPSKAEQEAERRKRRAGESYADYTLRMRFGSEKAMAATPSLFGESNQPRPGAAGQPGEAEQTGAKPAGGGFEKGQDQGVPGVQGPKSTGTAAAKPVRFEIGKSLSEADKKAVLKSLKDAYKEKGLEKEEVPNKYGTGEFLKYPHRPDLFETSDITGAKVRHYVELPGGKIAHPSELYPNLKQHEIDREIQRREYQERQDKLTRELEEKLKTNRIARKSEASETDPNNSISSWANRKYAQTRRPIEGSYWAENEAGDRVRVDGKDPKDVAFYESQGFKPIQKPVGSEAPKSAPAPLQLENKPTQRRLFSVGTREESEKKAPIWYSKLAEVVRAKMGGAMDMKQLGAMLLNNGVKPEEVQWSRLGELGGKVTKDQVLDHLAENAVQVTEKVLGAPLDKSKWTAKRNPDGGWDVRDERGEMVAQGIGTADADQAIEKAKGYHGKYGNPTKFQSYQLPGGKDYRELLLTLPHQRPTFEQFVESRFPKKQYGYPPGNESIMENLRREYENPNRAALGSKDVFRSSHFDDPNVLAHVRFNTRTDADGKRVLAIEEVQSDWHQQGRDRGYGKADTTGWTAEPLRGTTVASGSDRAQLYRIIDRAGEDQGTAAGTSPEHAIRNWVNDTQSRKVPDAPFKKTWHELAMKRIMRYAAENGYDRVAWMPGEVHVDRYDLSKKVEINYHTEADGRYWIHVTEAGTGRDVTERTVKADELEGIVGKEIAQKIVNNEGVPSPTDTMKQLRARGYPTGVVERDGAWWIQYPNGKTEGTYGSKGGAEGDAARMKKMLDAGDRHTLKGDDLKIGGQGMRGFYDKILPDSVSKLIKKYGAKVEKTQIPSGSWEIAKKPNRWEVQKNVGGKLETQAIFTSEEAAKQFVAENPVPGITMHSFDVTPAMKADVLEKGQPLFSIGPTIKIDGEDRPTRDSEGRQLHPTVEGVRNFWKWFGGSKVVDTQGRPVRVYHGTTAESKEGFHTFSTKSQVGAHLGTVAHAEGFAAPANKTALGGRIYPVYLDIKNPIRLEDRGYFDVDNILPQLRDRFGDSEALDHAEAVYQDLHNGIARGSEAIKEFLQSQGFDGIVYMNRMEGIPRVNPDGSPRSAPMKLFDRSDEEFRAVFPEAVDSYVAFDPAQIKSATGNTGAFDPSNPDIRYSVGPTPEHVSRRQRDIEAEKETGEPRELGRPELANPVDPNAAGGKAREFVDAVDLARKDLDIPAVKPDRETFTQAADRLKADPAGEKDRLLTIARAGGQLSDVDTVIAKRIIATSALDAVSTGDRETFAHAVLLAHAFRETGTESGRALRQRRDDFLPPAERLQWRLAEIITAPSKANAKAHAKLKEQLDATADPEERAKIVEKLERVAQETADQAPKIAQAIRDQGILIPTLSPSQLADYGTTSKIARAAMSTKATIPDRLQEYWINSLLSAPTTHVANVIGNTGYGMWETLGQRLLEASMNKVIQNKGRDSAQFGDFAAMARGLGPALQTAGRAFLRSFSAERPWFTDQILSGGSGQMGVFAGNEFAPQAAISGKKGRMVRIPTRSLLAADQFAQGLYGTLEAYAIAHRIAKERGKVGTAAIEEANRLIGNLSDPLWAKALERSKELTFQTELDPVSDLIADARRRFWPAVFAVPFVKTPVNIFKAAAAKTPGIGQIAPMWRIGRALTDRKFHYSKNQISRDVSNALVGWGTTAALWSLVGGGDDDGRITGSRPRNPALASLENRTAPPMSIKVGDRWVSYARIEPFATTFAMVVDGIRAAKTARDSGAFQAAMGSLGNSLLNQLQDKTFLKGVADIVDAIENRNEDGAGLGRWSANFLSSWVPALVRQGQAQASPSLPELKTRVTSTRGLFATVGLRTAQRALPAIVGPEPKIDPWGRDIDARQIPGYPKTDYVYRMMVPVRMAPADANPIDRLLVNWNNQVENDASGTLEPWAPRVPPATLRIPRQLKPHLMSDQEYTEFLRDSGGRAAKKVQSLIDSKVLDVEKPTARMIQRIKQIQEEEVARVRDAMARKIATGR